MLSFTDLLPYILGLLPPFVSVVALILTGGLRLRNLRGSTYNRRRILNEIADFDKEFCKFLDLLFDTNDLKYPDIIALIPASVTFLITAYFSITEKLTSPYIFILLLFSTYLGFFLTLILRDSFHPKFTQQLVPEATEETANEKCEKVDSSEEKKTKWRLEGRQGYKYVLLKALLTIPYGAILIVFSRVFWDILLYSAIQTSSYFHEFVYSIIVFFSTLVFLIAYGNSSGRFLSTLEGRIYSKYKKQTENDVEPEIEVVVSGIRGVLIQKSGNLIGIGLDMEFADNGGHFFRFQWKDIVHIGTRRK